MFPGSNPLRLLLLALLLQFASLAQAQNLEFAASADARIRQDQRMINFGADELGVETDLRGPGNLFERSFLRFQLSGVDPEDVDCVTLRLRVTTPGDCHFELREVTESWVENQVSWFNAPSGNGRRLGSWSGSQLSAGEFVDLPLARGFFSDGDGTYDLVLVEVLGGGTTRIGFDSREGSDAPLLIIGCEGLAPRAGFSARRTQGAVPYSPEMNSFLPVDVSTALWDFGDGSPPQNTLIPNHTYTTPGRYTVSVTASSPAGDVTVTRPRLLLCPSCRCRPGFDLE